MLERQPDGTVFGPFQQMWSRILDYLPSLAAGVLLLLLGLVVCWVVKKVIVRILLLLRLDRPLRNFRWAKGLSQADTRHVLANVVGNVGAVLVFLIFLENAFVVWQLEVLGRLIGGLVFYLPKLIVGTVVLIAGSIVATMAANRVRTGLALEGFGRAGLVGRLTLWGLMIVVAAITLEELGIAPQTVQAAFRIGLGSLGLVVVLAVGLGSRDAVARMWKAILDEPERNG